MADRPNRPDSNFLGQHREFFGDVTPAQPNELIKGSVARFLYNGKERTVFVVHPKWKGKMHGLDLKFIPRRPFLTIVNAPEEWSEQKLYEIRIDKQEIKRFDSYRTYDLTKIGSLRKIVYNSTLQEDEQQEQGIEESDQIAAFNRALGEGI